MQARRLPVSSAALQVDRPAAGSGCSTLESSKCTTCSSEGQRPMRSSIPPCLDCPLQAIAWRMEAGEGRTTSPGVWCSSRPNAGGDMVAQGCVVCWAWRRRGLQRSRCGGLWLQSVQLEDLAGVEVWDGVWGWPHPSFSSGVNL